MRKSCIECVLKHLGSAAIYIEETEMGYPNYFGYAYGELCHAASECVSVLPELAWAIREHRIKWSQTRKYDSPHKIPFEAMFAYLDAVEEADDVIDVPPEVYAGFILGEDGKPTSYSMDTRPAEDLGYFRNLPEGVNGFNEIHQTNKSVEKQKESKNGKKRTLHRTSVNRGDQRNPASARV